eukprot:3464855-Pleurochrysis_carterae.AAC.1
MDMGIRDGIWERKVVRIQLAELKQRSRREFEDPLVLIPISGDVEHLDVVSTEVCMTHKLRARLRVVLVVGRVQEGDECTP